MKHISIIVKEDLSKITTQQETGSMAPDVNHRPIWKYLSFDIELISALLSNLSY